MRKVSRFTREVQKKKFARAFIENGGNGTQAAMKLGPYAYNGARDKAVQLLKREDVQLEIQRALEETGIDYKYVLEARKKFVDRGLEQLDGKKRQNEPFISPGDTHKHLQGIEGTMVRLGEGVISHLTGSQHLHLHLEEKSVGEVIKKRNELSDYFNGILNKVIEPAPEMEGLTEDDAT